MSQVIQLILDALGMSRRGQLITCMGMLILWFALYAGKQFASQRVYATLYLALGLSFCVLMTTDNSQTREIAGMGVGVVIIALFAWYAAMTIVTRGEK